MDGLIYPKLDDQSVDDTADHSDEVESVPRIFEEILQVRGKQSERQTISN
jgi:hypothetical protein